MAGRAASHRALGGNRVADTLHAEAQGRVGFPALAVIEGQRGNPVVRRGFVTRAMLEVRPEDIASDNQSNDDEAGNEGPATG